jgi:hypothetical protein
MPIKTPDFQTTIADIPCGICIDSYTHVPPFNGPMHKCDSTEEFYGYTDISYTILNKHGREAQWLIATLTREQDLAILDEINQHVLNYKHDPALDLLSHEEIMETFNVE